MSNLEEQLAKYKEKYYETNKKNTFFKSTQKLDCAKTVSEEFNLIDLMKKSIYIIEESNKIFIEYLIVKHYLHPNNYNEVTDFIFNLCNKVIEKHGSFEIHANLKSFTISAAQRYSKLITDFCKKYLQDENRETGLDYAYIYNAPNIIQIIQKFFSPFISENSKNKLVVVKQN